MSKLMKADSAYREWLLSVAGRFRQSQIKAAMKVNDEMLRFYWTLGRDISCMHSKAGYGSSFYKSVSVDPHDIFRYVHSFSITNLKYVQYFYEFYPDSRISPRLEDNFKTQENRPQLGGDSGTEIFSIPWGHQKLLIDRYAVFLRRREAPVFKLAVLQSVRAIA